MTLAEAAKKAKEYGPDAVVVKNKTGPGYTFAIKKYALSHGYEIIDTTASQIPIPAPAAKTTGDLGHQLTEAELKKLEKKIDKEYKLAAKEMKAKFEKRYTAILKQTGVEMKKLKAGEITQEQYNAWLKRQSASLTQLQEMRDTLAEDMHKTNLIAHKIAQDGMANVYALNMNYGTYTIENQAKIDTGFSLYNHDAAEALLKEKKQLMPGPSTKKQQEIKANKDMKWNQEKIQSAVLQSVLQGENPYQLAQRLEGVAKMNHDASIRYARTMTTSVQNMGRYDAFTRAKDLGVDLVAEWNAILDNRTRHDHRMLHGQRQPVGEPFEVSGHKIMYPAQSDGPGASNIPQREIWNCRCTIIAWVKGFEADTVTYNEAMGEMSFEEWQWAKEEKASKMKWWEDLNPAKNAPQPAPEKTPAPAEKKKKKTEPAASQAPATTAPAAPAPAQAPKKKAPPINKTKVPGAQEFDEMYHQRNNFDDMWDKLTPEEQDAIRKYTGHYFGNMNSYLRGETGGASRSDLIATKRLCELAEKGLAKCRIMEDTQLYRGMGSDRTLARALGATVEDVWKMAKDGTLIGRPFTEDGFCSTGINGESGWDKQVVMDIHAPEGTPGLYVDSISRNQGEQELLLKNGTRFQIYNYEILPNAHWDWRTDRYVDGLKLYVDVVPEDW